MKHYTKKDFGTRNSDVVGGAIGGVAQGALSGASIGGPIGGIVGGALGGISSIFGSNKKKKALREANRKVDEANQRSINNFNNKADNIATETN
jgi:outer membrane lipoprotein SlyB